MERTKIWRESDATVTEGFNGDEGPDQPVRIRGGQPVAQPLSGTTVGPFTLVRPIGEGGMGEVFEAEQTEPVRRRVALKLIRTGRDHGALMARFEAERQALALMSHPNVASFLDAGLTDDGQPYFAMEYVDGSPITEFCRDRALSLEQRLALFVQVCRGVEHAHRRGIIHRDLKPSNVMVAELEGDAVPKIIDFGVAKAMAARLTERTLETMAGALMGTPMYMSPEQADPDVQDIDTRADVYALGALLYEMLTGQLLWEIGDGSISSLVLLLRAIREEEPLRPSTRIERSGREPDPSTSLPGIEPHDLGRRLRGDLDWIVMKALARDRDRRYGSASELAADVERHLAQEPVLARPPSRLYTWGRFARRHRAGVVAGAVALVALVAGTVAATVGFMRATEAEALAREEAEVAERVTAFMVDLFKVSDPRFGRGDEVPARALLDQGAESITTELADQPLAQARLMEVMGKAYHHLGLYEPAIQLLRQAYEQRTELLGPEHPDTLQSACSLGGTLQRVGQYDEAETLLLATLELQRGVLGDAHIDTFNTRNNIATLYGRSGRMVEAGEALAALYEDELRVLGPESEHTLRAQSNLANVLAWEGRHEEAIQHRETNLAINRRLLGDDHPSTILTSHGLASSYRVLGEYDKAEPFAREAVERGRQVNGAENVSTLRSRALLADVVRLQGRLDEAGPIYDDVLAIQLATNGADHPFTAETLRRQAHYFMAAGEPERARANLEGFMEINLMRAGEDDHRNLFARATVHSILGEVDLAIETLGRANEAGYPVARAIRNDIDLIALRGTPQYEAFLVEIEE
jgi:eukaryotic-like serine/threonine-protein kinase